MDTVNLQLEERIGIALNAAHELAEYWTGTMTAKILESQSTAIVEAAKANDYEDIFYALLPKLENTLAQASGEMERVEN